LVFLRRHFAGEALPAVRMPPAEPQEFAVDAKAVVEAVKQQLAAR
jgi:hypothetical protein